MDKTVSTEDTAPRDGPATRFYADPLVKAIYRKESDFFDLVLAAGVPLLSKPDDLKSYNEFVKLVQSCMDLEDYRGGNDPTAYFYEPPYLHVTVATLYPLDKQKAEGIDYDGIKTYFKQLVQKASQRPEWPDDPLQLEVKSSQLGSRAGILLWNEVTGGIHKIRQCLLAAEQEHGTSMQWNIHSIPGIVHTTFLRFSREPKTDGKNFQQQFQSKVLPMIHKMFPHPIIVPKLLLVCEKTPYVRIPIDDDHVLWTMDLQMSEQK